MTEAITLSFVDEDTGTRTVAGEAGNQGETGMIAVAWTIRNRMTWHPAAWWGDSVDAVCKKHAQYSCWDQTIAGQPNLDYHRIVALATTDPEYRAARDVLRRVFAGEVPDPTGGATTYKVRYTKATWDHAVMGKAPREIGAHDFWRLSPTGPCLALLDEPAAQEVA